ncbi:hypothetical protein ACTHS0_11520, partial [Neisseria sp. P0013.S009]|uniref:hypothetical protein n=1 Tax=Neisseria sp. P0013.S009 TaxID=3436745 RepID=UPI003F7E32B5
CIRGRNTSEIRSVVVAVPFVCGGLKARGPGVLAVRAGEMVLGASVVLGRIMAGASCVVESRAGVRWGGCWCGVWVRGLVACVLPADAVCI